MCVVAVLRAFGGLSERPLPDRGPLRFTPVFSPKTFAILALHLGLWSISS